MNLSIFDCLIICLDKNIVDENFVFLLYPSLISGGFHCACVFHDHHQADVLNFDQIYPFLIKNRSFLTPLCQK